jgi:predicted aspartyl protease
MGGIRVPVSIDNLIHPDKTILCDALVDTGASHMALPSAWRDRLGELPVFQTVELVIATQKTISATVCGPVRVQIEGFRPVSTEVAFVDMEPEDGEYEPLIGSIVLEQSQAAVDMMGDRLVYAGALYLK